MSEPFFAYAKTKTQISFAVTAKLISAFVLATRIVQSLYFLNTKSSAAVQRGLCRTRSETPKTGFLTTRLKVKHSTLFAFTYLSLTHKHVSLASYLLRNHAHAIYSNISWL